MKKLSKILVLVLALAMMFTLASMFTTSAANLPGGTKLYLVPNANWNQSNARFAAYFFGDGEVWVSMTKVEGETNLYEVTVPEGKNFTNVIFCRMNPSATANNWDNKWNQTADLTYNGTSNCYTVKEGTWDSGGGTWSTYGSTCLHANLGEAATCTTPQLCLDCGDPVVSALGHTYDAAHLCSRCNTQASFTVAGSGAHLGTEWDTGNTANDMTYADGVYTKVYTNVAAGSYAFKVVRDHDWGTAYPSADKAYTVATTGSTVTITLKGTAVTVTVDAPHVHEFVEGKCECGEEDPNYVPPHEHVFVDGKCECGEEDPNYVPPHVNSLVVGDTNKIVIGDAAVDNGFGYLVESVLFVADEKAHYEFVGENLTILVYDLSMNNLCGFTGKADLEAGTYIICIAANTTGTKGEFNVAVTKSEIVVPEHKNEILLGQNNKIVVDGSILNANGNPIAWVPFVAEEKALYTFASETENALVYIFNSDYSMPGGALTSTAILEPGNYLICVGNGAVGEIFVTVTMSEVPTECEHVYAYMNCTLCGAVNPYFEYNIMAEGTNKVVCNEYHLVDEAGHGNPYQFTVFTVTEDGLYRFSSGDKIVGFTIFTIEINTEGADWTPGTGAAWGEYIAGTEAELKAGTYNIGLIFVDGVGEYEITIEKVEEVVPPHEHVFVDGKCECGEEDPNWEPPVEEPTDPEPPVDEPTEPEVEKEEQNMFAQIWAMILEFFASIAEFFKGFFA